MRLRLLALLLLAVPVLAACGGDDEGDSSAGKCTYVEEGSAAKEAKLPPSEPKSADTLTVATNRGDMKLTLTPDAAPCTVNSFVSLAEQGYFDGTKCHRLVPGFVLQCGDPSATGAGGPGYSFDDELSGDETYPAGTLAMANAGPDTNGSQFFIVLADAQLPPSYTVFGKVDDAGLAVARAIEKDGNGPDGVAPAKDVVIESVS
ncbi:peptidylprolyl isomerase [Aeromicrobium senzhongii]|uniref:Peptidyl-prolyl cis-trans isomerase n=1 Tax=Aeromicrobium senzhongii TaxID=2663859 RepID=A0ABX6SSG0_9ACTN|nr:peptidylprolyl isomerase [Aeromicrobium senzhongii]MTB88614.1 peptidylprolyl isomerase [Aeromicrobium senzhongii]QNL94078.1 peptidylprolyl isomerase [Aeromicrobium senzhongii]